MADTAAENRGAGPVFTTARSLGTGTTSTVTMLIWRMLSDHLLENQAPMSAEDLAQGSGLSVEQIEHIFAQVYYQKHYGFRRFDSFEAWHEWAMSSGVLYNPDLHDPMPEEEEEAPLEDEDEEPEQGEE